MFWAGVQYLGFPTDVFRLVGDFSHAFAVIMLIYNVKQCSRSVGISFKTQYLYALVFIFRYLGNARDYKTADT